jgi:elongation factor P
MIASTDLRAGTNFIIDGQPFTVLKYTFVKMGRGSATVKVHARNLLNGSIVDKSFTSNNVVEDIKTTKRKLQFLYKDLENATFMDPKNYEQVEVPLVVLGFGANFLVEGGEIDVLFWEERALSVDLPPKITLKIAEADPGVRGNSASNIYKQAKLENGLTVKVPLFINRGELVRVDTRTGEYVERANKKE